MHKLCPNSLGCLLESGSPVSIGLIFPIPARPGLSGVRSTAGGVLAWSPNALPSVEAAPEVSFPHPEGLSVFRFAASTFPGTNTSAATAANTYSILDKAFLNRDIMSGSSSITPINWVLVEIANSLHHLEWMRHKVSSLFVMITRQYSILV